VVGSGCRRPLQQYGRQLKSLRLQAAAVELMFHIRIIYDLSAHCIICSMLVLIRCRAAIGCPSLLLSLSLSLSPSPYLPLPHFVALLALCKDLCDFVIDAPCFFLYVICMRFSLGPAEARTSWVVVSAPACRLATLTKLSLNFNTARSHAVCIGPAVMNVSWSERRLLQSKAAFPFSQSVKPGASTAHRRAKLL